MSSILTVSQLNRYVSHKLSSDVKLRGLAIKGEISNYSLNYRSGHAYFSIKDENSALRCVMFRSNAERLRFEPENGMSVLAFGDLEVYERDGVYQLVTLELKPIGEGQVSLGLEQLKRKLADMGVFDASAKKEIPLVPAKIAVVTSASGAALQDILNILQRRYPVVEVQVFPANVQGEGAPDSICSALAKADKSGADTLILARGGGSQEDLMAFNSEKVALAIFDCKTPVISAVGHETDISLADLAADMRAPTPSAAAELAVPDKEQLISALDVLCRRMGLMFESSVEKKEFELREKMLRLEALSPAARLDSKLERIRSLENRAYTAFKMKLNDDDRLIDKYAAQLFALSPFNILERGYSITTHKGTAVRNSAELSEGDEVELRFASGKADAKIIRVIDNDI
ncbi:MAG: exodeoxyribonuclease VII large subunit [Ruminococcus sp.]|nr:exodeoxyribonuclease VII large subunit [Ruminococcus sp.]